jgi:hypothetical protein
MSQRSTARDYLGLAKQAALFAIVPALVFALPVWELDRLGELRCLDTAKLARDQVVNKEDVLYGPAYSDCTENLKMTGLLEAKADVLSLGTSRSVQLRSELFAKSFYNAGGTTPRAESLREFLAMVPRDAQPKLVVLVLDQFFVNADTDKHSAAEFRPLGEALSACVPKARFLGENWMRPYRDVLARKIPASLVLGAPRADRLGVRAQVQGSGYRRDGSFQIAGRESFDEVRDRMAKGVRRYEPAEEISEPLAAEVERFAADARARGIDVVAIMPPWAPTIYDEMHAIGKWRYVDKVQAALAPRFAAHGQAIYDYSDVRDLGLGDDAFYDGHHPSERVWGVILLDVAKKDDRIAKAIDAARIEQMLHASADSLSIVSQR